MKQDQNLRFVIIGMGYLMEYIAPCYSKLLGDKKAEQMLGVTAEPQAVQTKAKATGIPVILNDNAGALRRMEPDIILFAPPPSLAAPLTESVLVPYFAECRAAGKELPMLFAFPPKPEGKYYQEQLGHDCKVVNILPNMISEICGRTCAEAGFTMVTLPESHTWQPEELDFIRRFWQPLGQVVFLTPAEVQVALAVSCSNQMLSEIFLDMQTALPEAYRESASALAEAARAYLMEKLGYQPPQPVESSVQAVPPAMLEAVKKVTYHAHCGTLKFMLEKGFDLNDLLEQMKQIQKMGSMKSIIRMLPGANKVTDEQVEQGEVQLKKTEAMINSMTRAEREKPAIIDPKRKRRIAAGSGTQVSDVNQLLKQFEQMQKMMKQFGIGGNLHGKKSRRNRAALLKGLGGGMPQ